MYRNCPGRYLADRQGFIFIAALLWAFKIEPAPGEARLDPSKASFIDSLAASVRICTLDSNKLTPRLGLTVHHRLSVVRLFRDQPSWKSTARACDFQKRKRNLTLHASASALDILIRSSICIIFGAYIKWVYSMEDYCDSTLQTGAGHLAMCTNPRCISWNGARVIFQIISLWSIERRMGKGHRKLLGVCADQTIPS